MVESRRVNTEGDELDGARVDGDAIGVQPPQQASDQGIPGDSQFLQLRLEHLDYDCHSL